MQTYMFRLCNITEPGLRYGIVMTNGGIQPSAMHFTHWFMSAGFTHP